jgi:hypothetical protein
MNAYQNFLDFFSTFGKGRLDGLSSSHFDPMTPSERGMAFEYLLKLVQAGGSEESVNGLFLADEEKAVEAVKPLLTEGLLRPEAKIVAAWNLYKNQPDDLLIPYFVESMRSSDRKLREKAAYWAPAKQPTLELLKALEGMVVTETETLPLIHATNKLLECHGVTRESVDKSTFSDMYKGLRSENVKEKFRTFDKLNLNYPI